MIINNRNYLEINWLRAFAVILLVTWHCLFCVQFVWGVVTPGRDVLPFMLISRLIIPDAMMPLFTFISGYLFCALFFERGKYQEFGLFLWSKVKRLIIPFFVFSPLIIWTSYNMNFTDFIWGEGCHMWYCPMLFWCFILAWVLLKINSKAVIIIVSLFSTCLVFAYPNLWFLPFRLPLGIDNGFYYFSYFAFGGAINRYKTCIYNKMGNMSTIWLVLAAYIALWIINCMGILFISRLASSLQCYLFVVLLWLVVMKYVENSKRRLNEKLSQLCKCSFGIYVFHHWIAWDIVWFPPLRFFLQNNYLWLPVLATPIIFVVSYGLTKVLLKTRIGLFLLA